VQTKNVITNQTSQTPDSPIAYLGPQFRLQAARQCAVDDLRRALRRVVRCFGADAGRSVLDVAAIEVGAFTSRPLGVENGEAVRHAILATMAAAHVAGERLISKTDIAMRLGGSRADVYMTLAWMQKRGEILRCDGEWMLKGAESLRSRGEASQ
jgi:hypothetical protein